MTVRDFIAQTRDRYRDAGVLPATKYTLADAAMGVQRRISPDLGRGEPVWNRDWDILCVLDACRVDLFRDATQDYHWLPGRDAVDAMWSLGSASPEWVGRTFDTEQYADEMARTAYITANPFSSKPGDRAACAPDHALPLRDQDFAHLDEAWQSHWRDEPVSVVPPETMTAKAIQYWRQRPPNADRLIIHYMQPHIPFRSHPEWFGTRHNLEVFGEPAKESGKDPWKQVRDGELPRDDFWTAYRDNLDWVLDSIDTLRRNVDAQIALSADHGNAMGEWGAWSHPAGVAVPVVRRVPWTTIQAQNTMQMTPDIPEATSAGEEVTEDVDDRLEALGYA